jgi:hypothetical protein
MAPGVDVDFEIADRFQAFSTELLRIALLLLAGFALLGERLLQPMGTGKSDVVKEAVELVSWQITPTIAVLVVTAAAALLHRYFATDALVHIAAVRRLEAAGKPTLAERDLLRRDLKFSGDLLFIATCGLAIGTLGCASIATRVLFPRLDGGLVEATAALGLCLGCAWAVLQVLRHTRRLRQYLGARGSEAKSRT